VISDELNHASIIDGIRLSKARRFATSTTTWKTCARNCGRPMRMARASSWCSPMACSRWTAPLRGWTRSAKICDGGALLGIDECHATGFMGARGRGTHEARGVFGKIDIITGTLGKALGGASGGFTSGRKEVSSCCANARDLSFLEHRGAGHRWRQHRRARYPGRQYRAARQAGAEHRFFREGIAKLASTSSPATIRSCRSWSMTPKRRRAG
jgi:hypothetical protein